MLTEYKNPRTGVVINLEKLNDAEKQFVAEAMRRFNANTEWIAFDQFAFGLHSPLYDKHRSHKDVLRGPLYLALRDMSLQLGVQQGKIAARRTKQSRSKAEKAIA